MYLSLERAAGATDPPPPYEGSTPPLDYKEHLEIDFEDKDDTPPPWEEPEGQGHGQHEDGAGAGTGAREDTDWVADAVRDVGYFLRQHKFNEHDRRDNPANNVTGVELGFVGAFPTLRSLHWEVRDACDQGFLQCLRYLQDKLSVVRLRRADDTAKAMWDAQLSWPIDNATAGVGPGQDSGQQQAEESGAFGSLEDKLRHQNRQQVLALDKVCSDLKADDEADYDGFLGPLDRFQWRTTAAYYMCAFTMKAEPALRHFGEPCDNWAWCLDWDVGPFNGDPRARDAEPYECARYSFCPDPCCPRRRVRAPADCVEDNPCRYATETVGRGERERRKVRSKSGDEEDGEEDKEEEQEEDEDEDEEVVRAQRNASIDIQPTAHTAGARPGVTNSNLNPIHLHDPPTPELRPQLTTL
ncbi:Jacalin-related lectin 25 [Frankliniella fusca]|uniref:Jacalin-related lectin 25 n=1 Tax=Frankliniella fusca TaxID=407009 RepID=A0AAE1GXP7_9NEOP|nr:Jacalin-related lectin 25 [Frankliniella fusca]